MPQEDLPNAIALNAIVFNGAAIVGLALGGALVLVIGYAGDFFLNGLSYPAVLIAILLMSFPRWRVRARARCSVTYAGVSATYYTSHFWHSCSQITVP